eukprot:6208696-Pleurochrysis_carterae.AAC.8
MPPPPKQTNFADARPQVPQLTPPARRRHGRARADHRRGARLVERKGREAQARSCGYEHALKLDDGNHAIRVDCRLPYRAWLA